MAFHILTIGQMQKFVHAVGGVPKTEIAGGSFSTLRLRKLTGSINGLRDWPKITDDPMVNFAIDCVVADDGEEPVYDEQVYAEEIRAFGTFGAFA